MSGYINGNNEYIKKKIPQPNTNSTKPIKFSQLVRNGHRYGRTQVIINTGYNPVNESYGQALKNTF